MTTHADFTSSPDSAASQRLAVRPLALAMTLALLLLALVGCSKSSSVPNAPPPGSGALFVRSVPASAELALDGNLTGSRTPKLLSGVSSSGHAIRLRMVGYADSVLTVTPTAGSTDTVSVSLRPLPGTPRTFSVWKDLGQIAWGLAPGPGGTIYATTSSYFWVLGPTGQTVTQAGLPLQLQSFGLTVNSAGQAYFGYEGRIRKYSQAGTELTSLGDPLSGGTDFDPVPYPALGRNDTLWAVTRDRDLPLFRFAGDAFHSSVWASVDSTLYAIACNQSDGTIYAVASQRNLSTPSRSILKLAANGQVLTQWVPVVSRAIALGPDGSVYVAGRDEASLTTDGAGSGRVQRYSSNGALIAEWAVENVLYTWSACDIPALAVDGSGDVYLCDYNGHRILKFVP